MNKKAPIADKIPFNFTIHNEIVNDEYAWLRAQEWPNHIQDEKILSYLQEENQYYANFFSSFSNEKELIFEELKGRIKLSDQSTYIKKDNYYYYTRTEEDKQYPIYCRKLESTNAPEEIILDVNELAKGQDFIKLGDISLFNDHQLMAYSVDFIGDEQYTIKVFDLKEQKYLKDEIKNTSGSIVWHEKIQGFFYTPVNENLRHDTVMFHNIGNYEDQKIFHERDNLYQVYVSKSSSKDYIFIISSGHDNNEIYIISMSDTSFSYKVLYHKEEGVLYDIDHNGDYFYVHTNKNAENFCINIVNINDYTITKEYISEIPDKYLEDFDITKNYIILNYTFNGLPFIIVRNINNLDEKIINFPDAAFTACASSTNFEEDDIRVGYSSLGRPSTSYSYDFNSNKLSILKVQEIPSGFDPDEYNVERIFANHDNVNIPITLFYKKSLFKHDGTNPLYLYGYGSYGISIDPGFRNTAVSIADRGMIFGIAHIRGGDDLGYSWYTQAKFLNKKNTFNDFIAVAHYLINEKYTNKGNIIISGGSAGGLLIGAVLNQEPSLFKGAIAHVPFVDVLNTMLDETLPLTPGEFKEWGNPKDIEYFKYIKSYSPYDNIAHQNYPPILVTAGLSDPRVGYWEAAKWVAKLRDKKTDNNIIILKTNMEAGHSGKSGRFDYLKEIAEDLVFIFNLK